MKTELLDNLITFLCEEKNEQMPTSLSEAQKADLFRALCNVRPPMPLPDEFLKMQDEYLQAKTRERGVIDVKDLPFLGGISLWQGDITRLNADAIVNACNAALLGCFQPLHNCIDNVIHSNAGIQLRLSCDAIMQGGRAPNGGAVVTSAFNLPSKYVFHTVGPIVNGAVTAQNKADLESCYLSCLNKAREMRLQTIAFCCLSTGVYGYPKDEACRLAVKTAKQWLSDNPETLRVIFNVFTNEDKMLYEREI